MKKLLAFILFVIITNNVLAKGKLHAFGFFSTNDQVNNALIRQGTQIDLDIFRSEVRKIGLAIGYDLDTAIFYGSKFTKENAEHLLTTSIDRDDIVFVYFDSHGFRYKDQS